MNKPVLIKVALNDKNTIITSLYRTNNIIFSFYYEGGNYYSCSVDELIQKLMTIDSNVNIDEIKRAWE